MTERTKTQSEKLWEQAKEILVGVANLKESKYRSELLQAGRSLVRNLGLVVIDEIAPENEPDKSSKP